MNLQDFRFRCYGVAYEHRCGELPILVQEYSTWPRHIRRNHGVHESGGQASLNDQMLELGFGGKGLIEMQRIEISSQLRV